MGKLVVSLAVTVVSIGSWAMTSEVPETDLQSICSHSRGLAVEWRKLARESFTLKARPDKFSIANGVARALEEEHEACLSVTEKSADDAVKVNAQFKLAVGLTLLQLCENLRGSALRWKLFANQMSSAYGDFEHNSTQVKTRGQHSEFFQRAAVSKKTLRDLVHAHELHCAGEGVTETLLEREGQRN
jgi:hypothetical protein